MKINLLTLLLLAMLAAQSCIQKPFYGVGNIGSESRLLLKPVYNDTIRKASYVTGHFSHDFGSGYQANENDYYFDLMLHRSYTAKTLGYSYGGSCYLGNYDASVGYPHNGPKSFYGASITGEINTNIPFDGVDWRIIGVRTSVNYEGGGMILFRKNAEKDGLIYNRSNTNFTFNLGLTDEIVVKLKNNASCGLYCYMGMASRVFVRSNTLYYTKNRYTGHIQITSAIADKIDIFSFGMTYRLK